MTAITTRSIDTSLAVLYINGINVSDNIIKTTFPSKWINNDVTAFGSVGRRYSPGIDETKFTVEMMFNQVVTTGSQTVIGAVHSIKSTVPFIFYPAGMGNGNTMISGNCSIPEYEITAQVGTLVKVTATIYVDNGLTYGLATTNYVFPPSYDGYIMNLGGTYSTIQSAASGNTVNDSANYLELGQIFAFGNTYYVYRGFLMFNTAALSGHTIVSAYLNLYCGLNQASTAFNLVVTSGGSTYPHNPAVVADYAIANYSGNGGQLAGSAFTVGQYVQLTLNSTGISWINQTATTKLSLVSSNDISATVPTGLEDIWLYASEQGTGYWPQLVVACSS